GRRMTWRPTPASAALGRVSSGGTSTTRSSAACARHASRQPARSSSGENARGSTLEISCAPDVTRTLHFLHVPLPPHVESIATPFGPARARAAAPAGRRASLVAPSACSKTSRTRSGCASSAGDSTALTFVRSRRGLLPPVRRDPVRSPLVLAEQEVGG